MKLYSASLFKSDLFGGISVAALSIPIAVAYAEIAGMPAESGLYTAVFALLAYFILGSSSQAIIGTDFATVTLFSAVVVASLAGGNESPVQLMMMITVMTGVWMFVAGILKLGLVADFLSKPVLLGYLNGVSVLLIVSQLDKLTGLTLQNDALLRRILEVFQKAGQINWPTLLFGLFSILFLQVFSRVSAKIPAAIILFGISELASKIFDLGPLGIAFMPRIENPYPTFITPDFRLFANHFGEILFASAAVMFVSYTSAIPVVRGFSKDLKGFDPNKEFYALGLAHVLIGFFGGYPVSGDDSRTAVNIAVGGKTKFVNVIAAFLILLTVFLLPGVLTALPLVTISAIIASAGITMFERGAGIRLFKIDRSEFWVFTVCVIGVLALGVYQGMLFSIILAFWQLIKRSSRPSEVELVHHETAGWVPAGKVDMTPDDDILVYRFSSALLFYNIDYFIQQISQRALAKSGLKLIVIDASPINMIDLTAVALLKDRINEFINEGTNVVFAAANDSLRSTVTKEFEADGLDTNIFYPTIQAALASHSPARL